MKEGYDIVAFKVPDHHSIVYKSWLSKESLVETLLAALNGGANVVSIRKVED